jgi:glutaconate CoA-transferase, subunit A
MQAASLGVPFQPVPGLRGTDVAEAASFATVRNPYGDDDVYVVPAIRPEWAVLHVDEADRRGNARLYGARGYDLVMAEAAAHVMVTAEEIVSGDEFERHPERTQIPGIFVDVVVHAPRGAFPCGCAPRYDVDADGIEAYLAAAGSPDLLRAYLDRTRP